jgi:hypothetical protein
MLQTCEPKKSTLIGGISVSTFQVESQKAMSYGGIITFNPLWSFFPTLWVPQCSRTDHLLQVPEEGPLPVTLS